MKSKELKVRLSERRMNIVRSYAVTHDKTMTQVIEELIDSLAASAIGKNKGGPSVSRFYESNKLKLV